jgi:NAD(P)-dependent dehydrogenase (short-subunit alcohol dehydrogenase family)
VRDALAGGPIDVLVANLAIQAPVTPAAQVGDVEWREVPLGRLVAAREDAAFVAYLCSSAADCFAGQVFPVCGGWAAR